jgi:surface antigen
MLVLSSAAVAKTHSTGKPHHRGHGGNCVAYAREVTGINISGNAGLWWNHAEGRYQRGHRPAVGAIMVFKPYGKMRSGHVAVVSRLVGSREILIDHANWVRGRVSTAMSVTDVSPNNDWSVVKVSGTRDNPVFGFIYPHPAERETDTVITAASSRPHKDKERAKTRTAAERKFEAAEARHAKVKAKLALAHFRAEAADQVHLKHNRKAAREAVARARIKIAVLSASAAHRPPAAALAVDRRRDHAKPGQPEALFY